MTTCNDVASALLARAHSRGLSVCNLKLQKLVYYCQGYHLALIGQPLFQEELCAWTHGPVQPGLYHQYKFSGNSPIPVVVTEHMDALINDQASAVVDAVLDKFGDTGAWFLRNQTHNEQPWKNHELESGQADGAVITHDEMMEYFKMELSESHDRVFSALMDAVESAERDGFVTLPHSVQSADDFVAWIKAQ